VTSTLPIYPVIYFLNVWHFLQVLANARLDTLGDELGVLGGRKTDAFSLELSALAFFHLGPDQNKSDAISLIVAKPDGRTTMPSLAPDSTSSLVSLLVHVYQTGELYARYQLLSGEVPQQAPAIFENRDQLAMQLRELGLLNEAALVLLSNDESDLAFQVALTPDLTHSLGFDRSAEVVHQRRF
jgi:hypothetical protein